MIKRLFGDDILMLSTSTHSNVQQTLLVVNMKKASVEGFVENTLNYRLFEQLALRNFVSTSVVQVHAPSASRDQTIVLPAKAVAAL